MSKTKFLYLKVMISKFRPDVGGHEENGWGWARGGREGGKKISEEGIYHECHVYLYDST